MSSEKDETRTDAAISEENKSAETLATPSSEAPLASADEHNADHTPAPTEAPKADAVASPQPKDEQAEDSEEANQEEEAEEEEAVDYSQLTKSELLQHAQAQQKEDNFKKALAILKELKPFFEEIAQKERQEALEAFLADGGEAADFDYKQEPETKEFFDLYQEVQQKYNRQRQQSEQEREKNLKTKELILEKLRQLIDAEESETSIEEFKKLQTEWRGVGPVPAQHNRTLWASYNALVEMYYDQRSIYFELKELDRRKNLALKLELCERAEKLLDKEPVRDAIKELQELHEEYKHIGPVPKEEQEIVWQRFKAASDQLYDKKRAIVETIKAEKQQNLEAKLVLCQQVEAFATFESDRITAWNAKTKEILELQNQWEAIRMIPKEKVKEVSKQFWTAFKTFFQNKNLFFKEIERQREENLKAKEALCERAEAIVNSDAEPQQIAAELKTLQQEWKEIGPAPSKQRQSIYDRFKATCDSFFEQRRKQYASAERSYEENLKAKESICDQLAAYTAEQLADEALVREAVAQWNEIGFVPKNKKKYIEKRFQTILNETILRMPVSDDEKQRLRLSLDKQSARTGSNPQAGKRVQDRSAKLKKRIKDIENDIAILRNNLEFFANTKKANSFKESFEKQVEEKYQQLDELRTQLAQVQDEERD
ncbi:DUF349 domain-containing protein [Eisenibacter elegans]|jgi:hypothetical protein|uniref:DUF349 domain-containing protein n=1 Tax=Eisenibacter elegans TaxID=997 RepID=UPI000424F4E6|nr:DUF349 domain-containing protein [Eisenibacter elegans]